MRRWRRGRGTIVALAAALATPAPLAAAGDPADARSRASATPAPAVPSGFVGLQAWTDPGASDFERMARAGVESFRANVSWSVVEPAPGELDWQRYDGLFRRAARAGLRILPVLVGSPGFAARSPHYPPRRGSRSAYASFVRQAVGRYGRGGSFWEANPDLPARAALHWQVWNEPNLDGWWNGRPSAREYVSLLRLTRTAIRSADPRALIVLAGMPVTAHAVQAPDYLRAIYAIRGASRLFDVVAVHAYARDADGALDVVARTRRVMRRAESRVKPIWVTEVGWGSRGEVNTPGLSRTERAQAALLRATLGALVAARVRHGVDRAFWFSWRDREPVPGEIDWWALHTGLFREDGSPKPAWRAFRAAIRGGR